jgi:inner membrane protein
VDNITHSLAGAALGQAGLKRVSGLGMAALVIGANIPDVDIFAGLVGLHSLSFRRGWTHGPIAMVVLPALLTAALVAYDNWQLKRGTRAIDRGTVRPLQLYALALIGCLTHPLLDWMNTYGVRFLMPFTDRWFYGDTLFIVDVWVWLVLGLGVLASWRRYRARHPRPGRPARTSLVLVTAYILAMIAGSRYARGIGEAHIAETDGVAARRVMAGPVFLNSLRRGLIIDQTENYRFATVAFRPSPHIELDTLVIPTNLRHPLAIAAREREDIRRFLYWSRFPFFVIPADTAGAEIELRDARFRGERLGTGIFRRPIPVAELRRDEPND